MSNYYYDEKQSYLEALNAVGNSDHNLTQFLKFGLRGIALQTNRLAQMIKNEVSKQIFRNLMHDLFTRLESTRKRVIVKRQLVLLERLLGADEKIELSDLLRNSLTDYKTRKNPRMAMARDLTRLMELGAIEIESGATGHQGTRKGKIYINVKLDWPTTITDSEFFAQIEQLPKAKTHGFLATLDAP